MLHEVDDATLVLEGDFLFLVASVVDEHHLQALVEERDGLQTLCNGACDELRSLRLENLRIGPEADGCSAGSFARRRSNLLQFAFRLATIDELLAKVRASAMHFGNDTERQRIHHAHTDTVQTAGHLVTITTELSTRVQHGEHYFERALSLVWTGRVRIDGNAAAVVDDFT